MARPLSRAQRLIHSRSNIQPEEAEISIPTKGETYAKLMEYIRKAQEEAAMLGHLNADDSPLVAKGWLGISELFKSIQHKVTELATRGLQ